MKLLVLADAETLAVSQFYQQNGYDTVDVILSCGDLPAEYLTTVKDALQKPLLYVKGNHDGDLPKLKGATPLDCKCVCINGVRFCGFGAVDRKGRLFTEETMHKRIKKVRRAIKKVGGVDVLVTHYPMAGHGDGADRFHKGYEAFRQFVDTFRPQYMFYGHVHLNYSANAQRVIDYNGTKLINAYEKTVVTVDPAPNPKGEV